MILQVQSYSDTAIVVTHTRMLAKKLGFSENNQFLVATVASELATNLVRYAGGGEIALREIDQDHRSGLQVVARDQGPGIADLDQAMRDHFSTGNGLGLGLSSIKRIMDEFIIDTAPGRGTLITVRKWK